MKLKYKDLSKEEKAFIKTKVNTILFNVWIEKEIFIQPCVDELGYEDNIELENGYFGIHAKYRIPVAISLILLSPLVILFYTLVAMKDVIIEFAEDYYTMPQPFGVCSYKRDRFIDKETCPHGYVDWDECPDCCH